MTEIGKKDKLPVRSPTAIAQFEPSARKELIVRGLMELADVQDADFYFFKGEDSRLRGKWREAISNYEKALHIDPEHEDSLFWTGYCYLPDKEGIGGDDLDLDNTTRNERAASAYQRLVAVREKKDNIWWGDYALYYNLGLAQYNLDLDEAAIESFERAIELNPDDANSHYMVGLAQYYLGLYEEAIESFERAIELNPDDANSHYMVGLAQHSLDLYEERQRILKELRDFGALLKRRKEHAKELNQSHEERQERIEGLEKRIARIGALEKRVLDLDARKRLWRAEPDATPESGDDPYSKLEKLASLKEKGIISEEEFDQEKKKILGK